VNKFSSPVSRVNAEVIGLDVHQKITACCRLDRRGRKLSDHTIGGDRESLEKFLLEVVGRRRPHFALEACGGFEWVEAPPRRSERCAAGSGSSSTW
jgi:hypothetical protein